MKFEIDSGQQKDEYLTNTGFIAYCAISDIVMCWCYTHYRIVQLRCSDPSSYYGITDVARGEDFKICLVQTAGTEQVQCRIWSVPLTYTVGTLARTFCCCMTILNLKDRRNQNIYYCNTIFLLRSI